MRAYRPPGIPGGGGRKSRPPAVELLPPLNLVSMALIRRPPSLFGALIAASLGTLAGIAGALSAGRTTGAEAAFTHAATLDLRDAPLTAAANVEGGRSVMIAQILNDAPERLPVAKIAADDAVRPKLIVIFDDIGLDRPAFDEIMKMPGPVTLSFLPYAKDIAPLVESAQARGDDILLHLPMEPSGDIDAGPHSLSVGMSAEKLFEELAWNLEQFDGYVGVNNHMGSKFTRNEQAMKRVLAMLDQRGLIFIDSLTTGGSVALKAGDAVGADVFVRDVFLDAEPGRKTVQRQLALAEQIAAKTGYAIIICHPRRETLDMIGPWLTTALARGYELETVSSLRDIRASTLTASVTP